MNNCVNCNKLIIGDKRGKKYCSDKCKWIKYDLLRYINLICDYCNKEFKGRKGRKFCNQICAAKNRVPDLIIRNKDRRKYELIPGLTRQQIYWRNNFESREKHLKRDMNKRIKLINFLGGKCVKCGYKENLLALVLDHINSDGKKDRERIGSKVYRYYVNHVEEAKVKLQVLCANCNLIKSFEMKEHNISRRIRKKKEYKA